MRSRVLLSLATISALIGCTGDIKTGARARDGGGSGIDTGCYSGKNDEVRQKMGGACVSCHGKGTTKPFFAELAGFEDLLVYDTQYVVAGKPDESLLIKLLEGHGTGTFNQMPLSETYAAAVAAGKASITLDEIKAWVADLPPAPANRNQPDVNAITTRRTTAEEMRQALYDQLGLSQNDFGSLRPGGGWYLDANVLGLKPPNEAPGLDGQYNNDFRATARFEALGAPNTMQYRSRSKILSPSSLQVLVQVSQAWCALAVAKKDNVAVLSTVTLADTSQTSAPAIKQNIRALSLRMLSEVPSDDQVETIFQDVFVHYEPEGTDVAWTAVCASFVRDPLWILF